MLENFKTHIKKQFPFLKGGKLLIAISGGLDSVLLAQLCHKSGLDFRLAHCNFNLRAEESNGDEAFVLELAKTLNVEVFVQHFDTQQYATREKLSIQMAARELRYNWFEDLAKQLKLDYILTGHHADDNLETFLINLTRGTGLDGLTGIPETNKNIVRPLLPFSRETIESYALKNNFSWREDSSNASTKYMRNKLRHDVIPLLKEINPQLLQGFENTVQHLKDTVTIVQERTDSVLKDVVVNKDDGTLKYSISALKKIKEPKVYIYELFKNYGFTAFNDIYNLLDAQSGKQVFSETHRLLKDREYLIITPISEKTEHNTISILKESKQVEIPLGILSFESVEKLSEPGKNEIFVDAKTLQYPLKITSWKAGDFFYPIGMQGKKKLSKFFKDEKLSLLDKEKCLLLYSNNEVVWVINYRSDNRFKVSAKTKEILKITLDY